MSFTPTPEPEEPESSSAIWMISFADMISLLLAFFMLLYASGTLKHAEWKEMQKSLQRQFNPDSISFFSDRTTALGITTAPATPSRENLNYTYGLWKRTLEDIPALKDNVSLHLDGEQIILSIQNTTMFQPRDILLSDTASPIVKALGQLFYRMGSIIEIWTSTSASEFETESPSTMPWKNAGELSLARAMHVASLLHMYNGVATFAVYGNNRPLLSKDPEKQDAPITISPIGTLNIVIKKER